MGVIGNIKAIVKINAEVLFIIFLYVHAIANVIKFVYLLVTMLF
jgi:hypothetical protein